MSWIVDKSLTYFQQFCVNIIKCGPIPHHIAFIMDGNRRYASKKNVARSQGHIKGFDKLAETLQWCKVLGIKEVTVYAFSTENFKRTKEEVDTLMNLATEKFEKLLEEKDKIMLEGVCIRVIGNLELLSPKLRKLIAQSVLMTKDNNKVFLNIAFAYTFSNEITNAIKTIQEGCVSGLLNPEDLTENLISECLYTNLSSNPNILIRTSGEVRFSDFLIWQISYSFIYFTDVLWPEFRIWHLLICVFHYQRAYHSLKPFQNPLFQQQKNPRVQQFIQLVNDKRIAQLKSYLI